MNKTLEKLKNDPRVAYIDDERKNGNGIIVTLKGWSVDHLTACHTFGADSPTAALDYLKIGVKCHCCECVK